MGPRPRLGPQTQLQPGLSRSPAPAALYAARGRRVSALSRPPGAPSHGPGGTGGGRRGPCGARAAKRVCPIPETWTDPMTSSRVSRWLRIRGRKGRLHTPRPLSLFAPARPLPTLCPILRYPSGYSGQQDTGIQSLGPHRGGGGQAGGQVGRGSRCGCV